MRGDVESAVDRPQYNPFHEEDQFEMSQLRESRRDVYRPQPHRPSFSRAPRYNLTRQNDPEATQSTHSEEQSEMILFVERDIRASDKWRQLFCLSTLIIISQVPRKNL